MTIEFDKDYLRELFEQGRCRSKKYRFQPDVISRYVKSVKTLEIVRRIEELYLIRSLRFEALTGDRKGLYSVRVNDQYRIEFRLAAAAGDEPPCIMICTIVELSNHYK